tara:strand:+ start:48 stop:788 length:741 start_codon:yes stop_codon:yes gene_type:complete
MTNFIKQSKNNKLLTPETASFFIPVLIGLTISSILLPSIFFPRAKIIRELKSEIELLNKRIDYIPKYKLKLSEISTIYSDINDQNNRLIDLLAGEKDLSTVLSRLNTIAIDQKVQIVEVIPKDKISTLLTKNKTDKSNELKSVQSNDKLLVKSIEKYPIDIKIIGEYVDILNFVRELELLQTIVISSDLELIKAKKYNISTTNLKSSNKVKNNNLELNFTITFYGRQTIEKTIKKKDLIKKLSEGT